VYNRQRLDAFLLWTLTSSYGSSLTRLHLSQLAPLSPNILCQLRELPCLNLLELQLVNCSVQLCASSERLGLLSSCPALRTLELCNPLLLDGVVRDEPMQAAVAQLQHLTCRKWGQPNDRKLAQALENRLLPHLTALTCLDLDFRRMSIAIRPTTAVPACFCQHISSMVNLQRLTLAATGGSCFNTRQPNTVGVTAACGAALALSRCCILGFDEAAGLLHPALLGCPANCCNVFAAPLLLLTCADPISAATLPGIECLTAFEDLSLSSCALEPSCLLPMTTGLTNPYLGSVTLQPKQLQQDSALGASQLLQLLARLTALQHLALEGIGGNWPQELSAHSALTASSNLQDVIIHRCDIPSTAWVHVFPAGRTLPHLSKLSTVTRPNYTGPAPFGSAGIASLVSCCPELQDVACKLDADASLSPLQSLTALSRLHLPDLSAAVISQLAALTQLQELQLTVLLPGSPDPPQGASFGLQHLVPLTALVGLTELSCSAAYEEQQGGKVKPFLHLYTEVSTLQLVGGGLLAGREPFRSRKGPASELSPPGAQVQPYYRLVQQLSVWVGL
jgi:hypothetical protein